MQTRTLYYEDSHLDRFSARVISCLPREGQYAVILEETAFYPMGGGQPGDTGTLAGIPVTDTREEGALIVHLCAGPLEEGALVEGVIDYDRRFHYMQQHTGEHMVSGLLHKKYGVHNTGFHMGAEGITIDFDGVIPPEDLPAIEAEANRAVWRNLPLYIHTPEPEDLARAQYRTKRQLPWPVRLVEVPGVDCCACCGTHCASTGEVGLIKLFSSIPFRGGSRLLMACGGHALALLNEAYAQNKLVSQAFSAQVDQTGAAAQRMNDALARAKYRIGELERTLRGHTAAGYRGAGNVVHFEAGLTGAGLRELAEAIAQVCGGTAGVFSGSDEEGYSFCLADFARDLRPLGKAMTQALKGRGGGKPNFQQGSLQATQESIRAFIKEAMD